METYDVTDALSQNRNKLKSYCPIADDDFERVAKTIHEKHFNKGEVLLREGEVCRAHYFIFRGCIRSFGLEEGREVNVKFFFENDIACDFKSYRFEKPSQFFLVAMEDTDVLYGFKTETVPVLQDDPDLHMLLFRLFQDLFLKEEEHSNSFKLLSPEEHYQYLLKNKPEYLRRIPLIYLASYMGISRETLTRVRREILAHPNKHS